MGKVVSMHGPDNYGRQILVLPPDQCPWCDGTGIFARKAETVTRGIDWRPCKLCGATGRKT
jgi:DnaJ-class molecular chaperone